MTRFLRSIRSAALAGAVLASMALASAERAAAVTLPFDFTSGNPSTVAVLDGTSGQLFFSLDVGDPSTLDVFGTFAMDVVRQSDSAVIGSISLDGSVGLAGASNPFGDIANPPGVADVLYNINTWLLNVASGSTPFSLVVTSQIDSLTGSEFAPQLTLSIEGDLRLVEDVSAVPLPAALPLFAGGLGLLGLLGLRRRNARAAT